MRCTLRAIAVVSRGNLEARLTTHSHFTVSRLARTTAFVALAALAGCSSSGTFRGLGQISTTSQHGYVVSPTALEQVPVGSSRDQVLIALGSPSTAAHYSGEEVFYYISQTRKRRAAFLPDRVVDQRVVAVYFDQESEVRQIADYGLKDGKVFDFISRTTPTGGRDSNFLQQVLSGVIGVGPRLGG